MVFRSGVPSAEPQPFRAGRVCGKTLSPLVSKGPFIAHFQAPGQKKSPRKPLRGAIWPCDRAGERSDRGRNTGTISSDTGSDLFRHGDNFFRHGERSLQTRGRFSVCDQTENRPRVCLSNRPRVCLLNRPRVCSQALCASVAGSGTRLGPSAPKSSTPTGVLLFGADGRT